MSVLCKMVTQYLPNKTIEDFILTFLPLCSQHPQIQKKSQYIKYLCCDDVRTLHQWVNGIRIAKVTDTCSLHVTDCGCVTTTSHYIYDQALTDSVCVCVCVCMSV